MFVIEARLVEVACLCTSRRIAPARVLFTFAAKTMANQHVEIVSPCLRGDGDRKLFSPPLTLLESQKTDVIAIAAVGHLIGAGQAKHGSINPREAATAILAQITGRKPPDEPNTSWDDGLMAIQKGIISLMSDSQIETIFSFSKVYEAPKSQQTFSLSYSVTDEEGKLGSRYKVVVSLVTVAPK
jgi:hypothetical protein